MDAAPEASLGTSAACAIHVNARWPGSCDEGRFARPRSPETRGPRRKGPSGGLTRPPGRGRRPVGRDRRPAGGRKKPSIRRWRGSTDRALASVGRPRWSPGRRRVRTGHRTGSPCRCVERPCRRVRPPRTRREGSARRVAPVRVLSIPRPSREDSRSGKPATRAGEVGGHPSGHPRRASTRFTGVPRRRREALGRRGLAAGFQRVSPCDALVDIGSRRAGTGWSALTLRPRSARLLHPPAPTPI